LHICVSLSPVVSLRAHPLTRLRRRCDQGHIDAFLADDVGWTIGHVVADTSSWWTGRKLIDPQAIAEVSEVDSSVSIDASRQSMKSAPPCDPEALPERTPEAGQEIFP
jgi:hypothetical protein